VTTKTKQKRISSKKEANEWKFPESFNLDIFLRESYEQDFPYKQAMSFEIYKEFAEKIVLSFCRRFQ